MRDNLIGQLKRELKRSAVANALIRGLARARRMRLLFRDGKNLALLNFFRTEFAC